MAPCEALYGRWCQSPVGGFELGEARLLGTDLVQDALEKVKLIQDRLCMAQSRQKCYVDRKVRDVAYMDAFEKFKLIQDKLCMAQSRQKFYANRKVRDVAYMVGKKSEYTIQILEDVLHACVMDFGSSWNQFYPLAECAYNNSYQSSIQMAPYEALYGRWCQSPVGGFELGEARLLGTDLVQDALEKVKLI
ncbi:uncharacterized protein [Nicotiana tomentosiformis]|uniref:uncharacterized protein n=1 Tax=Nicotiana tomentosiformis TaxID=4098 RepID=UPI00388C7BFF